jgi:hypothetical protein
MPSSFSLIHQPSGATSWLQLWARSTGGAVPLVTAAVRPRGVLAPLGAAVGAAPTRASSTSAPRYARRCLQVRASIARPWLRHAGQVHA